MDKAEIVGEARAVYLDTGTDPSETPGGLVLAERHAYVAGVDWVAGLPCNGLVHCSHDEEGRLWGWIRLKAGLGRVGANWTCTHELIEFRYKTRGAPYIDQRLEYYVNQITAEVIVHRIPFRVYVHRWGVDLKRLAKRFATSQHVVALRFGEVFDLPIAIVGGLATQRRGPNILPSDAELRHIVAQGGSSQYKIYPINEGPNTDTLIILRT